MFFLALNRTEGDINKIEELTKGQSDNKLWFSFRSGVITASVANSVLSITKRLKPNPKTIENVVAKILNLYMQHHCLMALNMKNMHGNAMLCKTKRSIENLNAKSQVLEFIHSIIFSEPVLMDILLVFAVVMETLKLNALSHIETKV